MDAYDIANKIKELWRCNVPKNSGEITKNNTQIAISVETSDGILEVIDVFYDSDIGIILKVKD